MRNHGSLELPLAYDDPEESIKAGGPAGAAMSSGYAGGVDGASWSGRGQG